MQITAHSTSRSKRKHQIQFFVVMMKELNPVPRGHDEVLNAVCQDCELRREPLSHRVGLVSTHTAIFLFLQPHTRDCY